MSISIYIPVHNEIDTIRKSVISACEQNPLDIWIFDDCSNDGTYETLLELQLLYNNLNIIRYPEKSQNYLKSASENYAKLRGTHVIGLGGDDILENNIVNNCNKFFDAPIIFHNYYHINAHDTIISTQHMGLEHVTYLNPEQICYKFQNFPVKECGIATAIRFDCLKWLTELRFWELGAWSDSIGYCAVAAKYGAVYIPEFGSKFRVSFNNNKISYSQQSIQNIDTKSKIADTAQDFLDRAKIDNNTSRQLMTQWGLII